MKLKRAFCAVLAVLLLCLCACTNKTAQDVSETENTSVSENQETTLADVSVEISAGETAVSDISDGVSAPRAEKATSAKQPNEKSSASNSSANVIPAEPDAPKTQTISLSVTCRNAIDCGILDDPNFQGVVPENGVYVDKGSMEFTAGETVLTVLKRCLKSQKIVYQIDSSGYVKSIGGLSEFDCGAGSGWLYKVNGAQPNVSCKYYTLQAGDRVEFVYTCKMGDV